MNPQKTSISALLLTTILAATLVACPAQPPVTPTLVTLEGSVRLSRNELEKCESVTVTPNLKLGSLEAAAVRVRVDFGDGSLPQEGPATATYAHSYVRGGAFEVKTTASIAAQSQPVFSRTDDISIIANARDCTYIVELKSASSARMTTQSLRLQAQNIVAQEGGELIKTYSTIFDGFAARFTPEAAARVERRSEVKQADLGWVGGIGSTDAQWHLERVAARERANTKPFEPDGTGAGVDVFVIDTGVLATHEEFGSRVKPGFVAFNGSDTSDSSGHGTHVAALIAGKTSGVARAANIVPVRLTDSDTFSAADLLSALEWVQAQHKLRGGKTTVVNMSLGVGTQVFLKDIVDEKLEAMTKQGIVFVIAAGNRGNNASLFPLAMSGCVDGIIVVGAISRADELWAGSNWGDCVDLLAPGVNVISADKSTNTSYSERTGTSMAAPIAAGMVALMLEKNPTLTPAEIENQLKTNASLGKISNLVGNRAGTANRLLYLESNLMLPQKGISVEPAKATIAMGDTLKLTARVRGYADTGVNWAFNGVASSGNDLTFTAPSTPGTYTLTATSQADATQQTSAQIIVNVPEPQRSTVAAGYANSFAIRADGTLMGWGTNYVSRGTDVYSGLQFGGMVGDGSQLECLTPVVVMTDVVSVSSGGSHTLAVKRDGSVWAWGANNYGQLGIAEAGDRTTPAFVMGDAVAVSAGSTHSFAIKRDGTLWAWGDNTYGQLGDGSVGARFQPVQVMRNVAMVSAGAGFSVALQKDGTVWTWGFNRTPGGTITGYTYLGLSNSAINSSSTPIRVLSNVTQIAAGYFGSLALKTDGTVWGWGQHGYGSPPAPNGSILAGSNTPQALLGGVTKIGISGGQYNVLKADKTLWNWGVDYVNINGTAGGSVFPPVQRADSVVDFSSSPAAVHTLILKNNGAVSAAGQNTFGQIGDGSSGTLSTPVKIMDDVLESRDSMALKTDGTLWRWGLSSTVQQPGGGVRREFSAVPQPVFSGVEKFLAAQFNNNLPGSYSGLGILVLKTDKTVWTVRFSGSPVQTTVTQVLSDARDILTDPSSYGGLMAIKSDNSLWQLYALPATQIATDVKKVFPSGNGGSYIIKTDDSLWVLGGSAAILQSVQDCQSGLILKLDGTVWALGGFPGNGTPSSSSPVQIASNARAIARLSSSTGSLTPSYIVKTDGSVLTWGRSPQEYTPVVLPVTGVQSISPVAGYDSNGRQSYFVIQTNQTLLSGFLTVNSSGYTISAGDGTRYPREPAVPVLQNVRGINSNGFSVFAVKTDNSLWAWGSNSLGALGNSDPTPGYRASYVEVLQNALLPTP